MRPLTRPTTAFCWFVPTLVVALVAASAVQADDSVTRQYSFPLEDIDEITIHGNAGSMHFIETDHQTVTLILTVSHQDKRWFDNAIDLETVELQSRVRNGRLLLEQTEEDTATEWTIEMPARDATRVELGVGEIKGEFGDTELTIELGVGEVDIEIPAAIVGDIQVSAGVGEVNLSGAARESRHRAFVSHEVSGNGQGTRDLDVSVGVGEATVQLVEGRTRP